MRTGALPRAGLVALAVGACAVALLFLDANPRGEAPLASAPTTRLSHARAATPLPRLSPTGVLHGRVVRGGPARQPLAGHAVRLLSDGAAPRVTTTDAAGLFEFADVPPDVACELVAEPASDSVGCVADRRTALAVVAGERRDAGDLVLDGPQRVVVEVVDAAGRPVAGAEVAAIEHRPVSFDLRFRATSIATARTIAGGRAVIDVSRSVLVALRATAPGMSAAFQPWSRRGLDEPRPGVRQLVLHPAAVLNGTVTIHGAPVGGAAVWIRPMQPLVDTHGRRADPAGAWQTVTAAADGRFAFDALAPGEWQIIAAAPGALPQQSAYVRVPDASEVRLTLDPPAAVTGRVIDADSGNAAAGAVVRVRTVDVGREARAVADADGRFAVSGLPPWELLEVRVDGGTGWVLAERECIAVGPLVEGQMFVQNVSVRRGVTVAALVTDGGRAAAGSVVRLVVVREDGWTIEQDRGATGEDRRVTFQSVAPGSFAVYASPDDDALLRWMAWQDRMRDDAAPTATTSRRGIFEIDGLVEGEWTLEAFRGGGCCAGPYEECRLGTVRSGARGLEFRLAH